MDITKKINLIKNFAEEIVTEEELKSLFETKNHPVAYDGFEPSGVAPIHFGLLRATNLKDLLKVGVKFKLYLADYFGFINNKLGGDLEKIQAAGKYFIEVWKACGIDTKKVEVIWASKIMDDLDYWDKVLRVAKETTLSRSMKSLTIMGRRQGESLSTAQLMYPPMQVTDIFHMDIDICQLGMDQRRANMLARDIAEKLKWKKPIALHHHILLGLQGLKFSKDSRNREEVLMASKMSKSNPKSCIYMHDSFDEIKKKVFSAYCPIKQVEGNPILEYSKYIICREFKSIRVERDRKYGGDIDFENYNKLENSYVKGELHPTDLKLAVAFYLEDLIKPVRVYFEKNKKARALYSVVKNLKITR